MNNNITWYIKTFNELNTGELYQIIRSRVEVFVLEQNCPYQDLDNRDYESWHLFAVDSSEKSENRRIVAYLRVVKPGLRFPEPSIGRVITLKSHRRIGLGRELMQRGIEFTEKTFPKQGIRISAQKYLEHFYKSLGFETVSGIYLEDGIKHVEMFKKQ